MQAVQKLPRRVPIPHLSVVPSLVEPYRSTLPPPRQVPRPKAKPLISVPELRAEVVEELSSVDLEEEADTEIVEEQLTDTVSASASASVSVPASVPEAEEVKSQSVRIIRNTSPKIYAVAIGFVACRLFILAGRALLARFAAASILVRAEWTRALEAAKSR